MHHFVSIAFDPAGVVVTDQCLHVFGPAVAVRIDPRTGAAAQAQVPQSKEPSPADPAWVMQGLGWRSEFRETHQGPLTTLINAQGSALSELFGQLGALSVSPTLFAAITCVVGRDRQISAGMIQSSAVVRLRASDACYACAGEDFVAVATSEPHAVHVFRLRDGQVVRTSLALPEGRLVGCARVGSQVWAVVGHLVVGIDIPSLPWTPTCSATCFPLRAPAMSVKEPATVVFVLPGSLVIDHPRLGRLRWERTVSDPPVVKGSLIMLDDVQETLPGIWRILAWHPEGRTLSQRPPPPPVELSEIHVPEVDLLPSQSAAGDQDPPLTAELKALATTHGFFLPPLLTTVLRAFETDEVLRRWLTTLGFLADVRMPCIDWDCDPHLVGFAGRGNGDAYCLYPYPPLRVHSAEPPVLLFCHEDNETEFLAASFEDFLYPFLAKESARDEATVRLVAERLHLDPSRLAIESRKHEAPPWLTWCESKDEVLGRAQALIDQGNLVDAERLVASRWVGGDHDRAWSMLCDLYRKLGWSLPLSAIADR